MALEKPEKDRISIKEATYKEVIDYINKGHIHIPEFQREFVWSRDKIIDLLDSIYKGYPIGSIILWITENDFIHSDTIGNNAESSLFDGSRFFVIDGQQRLKSLYHAAKSINILTRGKEKEIDIYFDLKKDEFLLKDNIKNRKRSMHPIPGVTEDGMFFSYLEAIKEDQVQEYMNKFEIGKRPVFRFLKSLQELGFIKNKDSNPELTELGMEVLKNKEGGRIALVLADNAKYVKETLEFINEEPGITRLEAKSDFKELYNASGETAYQQFGRRCRWLRSIGLIRKEGQGYYLNEEANKVIKKLNKKDKKIKTRFIPLEKILVNEAEIDFDYLSNFTDEKRSQINYLRKRFSNYKLPLIIVNKEEWREVIDIFERINTSQQQLTIVDLMMAKTWEGDEFNLREELADFKKGAGKYIPEVTVLKIVSMNLIGKCTKEDLLSLDVSRFVDEWEGSLESIRKAVDFIKNDLNVTSLRLLPFPDLLVPLSKFYYINGNKAVTKKQKEELERWFWRASVSNRFGSAVDSKIEDDKRIMEKIADNEIADYKYTYPQRSAQDLIERKYSLRNAFVKTLLCLYSNQNPINIVSGSPVSSDNFSNYTDTEMHHIFPKNYLREKGVDNERINSVVNIMFLPGNVHRGGKFKGNPKEYFVSINNDNLEDDLKTHLIFDLEESGLLENDYDKFLKYRAENILNKLEEVTGEKRIRPEGGALNPNMPFSNEIKIRDIIGSSQEYIYWFDKYFTKKGLKLLREEIDTDKVKEIKILSGTPQTSNSLRKIFKKFKKELSKEGVNAEMRIMTGDIVHDIHDRWIISKNKTFNIQSLNTIGRGQYADITEVDSRPPFKKWWDEGLDIIQSWNKIQNEL